ncbi:uncharacterized protein METZ01_LOCUS142809 [marine metagenome]|uniref:Uncharacterized protein n=1 Tax=marine metagenome TaxID=408172 RepID=A0A381ZL17_9ZZZZ
MPVGNIHPADWKSRPDPLLPETEPRESLRSLVLSISFSHPVVGSLSEVLRAGGRDITER